MTIAPQASRERRRLEIGGVVQGVGFRPFVHRTARELGLVGFVLNDGHGVVVEAEGDAGALDELAGRIGRGAPALAQVEGVAVRRLEPTGAERGFRIGRSPVAHGTAQIPPDAATCDECLRELREPEDRRFRYPFINCTACGPRLTIVERVPYDRANTTMRGFAMCAECRREYEDPGDRRYHAEPIACPRCGPQLMLPAGDGTPGERGEAALAEAVAVIDRGGIVAIKGLGGYHLACDATDEAAVGRLRERKHREAKPFAVMTPDPPALVEVDAPDGALLTGFARPIVLARRRADATLAAAVAPDGNPSLGVMLPYTPLHHLLCDELARPLVMTSGNRSDEPIAIDEEDAVRRLGPIADAILAHDRPILRRCEDSVVRAAFPVRRSRGFAPSPVPLPGATRPIVAAGAELKATFCVARDGQAYLSPHLGDLNGERAYASFRSDLELYLEMLGCEPAVLACDLHPDFLSGRWAREQAAERGIELIEVQHHHAHAAACLAENRHEGSPALALVADGTGYGSDGTIWGGELLRCDEDGSFQRLAHLEPVPLPGGDAAIREPWRCAAAYLEAGGRPVPQRWEQDWRLVRQSLAVNAPLCSSLGRLFDAASALLGVRERAEYEAQPAIELEWLAADIAAQPYGCRVERGAIAAHELIAAVHDDRVAGRARGEIAAAFHEGVADALARACAAHPGPRVVALTGGCFQNLRLLEATRSRLDSLGYEVLTHTHVPANDGGVSYGQAAVAARRIERCA